MAEPVAFDAGPAKPRPTGVGVYVRELGHELRALLGGQLRTIGARPDGPMADGATTLMRGDRHLVWIARHADRDARRSAASLAHYTNAVAPVRSSMPFVVTIHDLSLLRYPHYHPGPRLAVIPFMAWAAHRARRVIVPSSATADEVRRLLRVPAGRVEVIAEAPVRVPTPSPAQRAASLAELDLVDRPFVLSLATLEPRKNIGNLVRAFERVAALDPELLLVLVGGAGWRTDTIEQVIRSSPAADRIRRLGYVGDVARSVLLRECAVFAYVSFYEGYGLPIVEAMEAGAPVVTSNLSSMPEAAGDAAILVDPRHVAAIAAGLREALGSPTALRKAGLRRVADLSWARAARETTDVYDQAAERWV